MPTRLPIGAALCLLSTLPAQSLALVRDLNTSSYPNQNGAVGDVRTFRGDVYFTANTQDTGTELYRSIGGTAVPIRVTQFGPGRQGSLCGGSLAEHAGSLWFIGGYAESTFLFRYDGNKVTRIQEVRGCSRIVSGPAFLFLYGYRSVVVSDGTAAGTKVLSRPHWRDLKEFTVVGKQLLFRATDMQQHGAELFASDGTDAGTGVVVDLRPGKPTYSKQPFGSNPGGLIAYRNKLLFEANDGVKGWAIYESDGTASGTKRITGLPFTISDPWPRAALGGKVYFGHRVGNQSVLYVTDGTATGTRQVKTGLPGIGFLTSAGGKLWFYGFGTNSAQLWASDGTSTGTKPVATVAQTSTTPPEMPIHHDGKSLFFLGHSSATGWEPWISDGTASGTRLLRDVNPKGQSSRPTLFVPHRSGRTFFAADGVNRRDLWVSDGAATSTKVFAQIQADPRSTQSSYPYWIQDHGGLASFMTKLPPAIWVTDGTTNGTIRIRSSQSRIRTSLGSQIFVPSYTSTSRELLVTDGTVAGTRAIYTGPLGGLCQHRGAVYFLGEGKVTGKGAGLWRTTGVASRLVKELSGNAVRLGFWMHSTAKGMLIAQPDTKGPHLWISDGTAKGTKEIDLSAVRPAILEIGPMASAGGRTFFHATVVIGGGYTRALACTDGTAAGTRIITDAANNPISLLGDIATLRDRVVFGRNTRFMATELWITDGTPAGTKRLRSFGLSPSGWSLQTFAATGDRIAFFAYTAAMGDELWSTDGTATGTRLVKEIGNGRRSFRGAGKPELLSLGDEVLFLADDGVHGLEPWVSDLTAAGTRMLMDLAPGPAAKAVDSLALFRGTLLFAGVDEHAGTELLRVGLGAHTQVLGAGCALGRPPNLRASTPRLGATLAITTTVAAVTSGQRGWVAFDGSPRRPVHVGAGCTLHVGAASFLVPFSPPTKGTTIRVAIPNLPVLHGLDLPVQAAVGPSNQAPIGLDLSNALLLCVRR